MITTITSHYVNGKFIPSHGQEVFNLISPVDGSTVGQVTLGDEEDARAAIAAAKAAFRDYGRSSLDERADYLQLLHEAIAARAEDHIEAMAIEYGAGRLRSEVTVARAARCFANVRGLLDEVPYIRAYGDVRVTRKPVGVSALITPWNSDLLMLSQKIAPALAAGCTVVAKPSELSALQTQVLIECIDAAGLPPGLINVVNGRGEVVGQELSTNADVAKISFTGSTAVGKTIMRNAADTMKRVTLELGGKAATVMLPDADLDQTVRFALSAAFMNSGQACIAGSRLVVPAGRLDEVKRALLQAVPDIKVGNPREPGVVIGPMVTEKQYLRVQRYIRTGIEEGAQILVGGEGPPLGLEAGFFVRPTVFVGVTSDMTVAQEEIFGPVLAVLTYDTEAEAIAIANDSTYGLLSYVVTNDAEHGREVADQLETGGVFVNELFDFYEHPRAPIGGLKQSGFGREFGVEGITEFLETHSVFARRQ